MIYTFKTKWSDFDPNRHMRHTAYNDYAAEVRIRCFKELGFDIDAYVQQNIGPVLFKEETSFFKEISIGENIRGNIFLEGCSPKGERWKIVHNLFKENGDLAAEIKVYGAWVDLKKRKLIVPPELIISVFEKFPKADSFEWITL